MSDFEERFEDLRAKFRVEASEAADSLDSLSAAELEIVAHRFSGIAGMFGHDEVGQKANALEDAIRAGADDVESRRAEFKKALRAV